jgi:Ricin-type beta-trefoil lectin domain/Subtilisin inhibitor-like
VVADTGCTTRAVADTAADADPATGVAVYDTYETTTTGWQPGPDNAGEGGTTAAAAIIAGVYALAGTPAPGTYPVSYLYQYPGASAPAAAYPDAEGLNDITTGTTGTCTPAPLCTAGTGYDAPTGMGTPAFTTSFAGAGAQPGTVYSGVTGKCLDDAGGSTADYNKVDIAACNTDTAEQDWTIEADGTVQIDGACLDVYHSGTANTTPVDLYACDGGGSQEWRPLADGSLVNPESGKCLADPSATTTDGTQLEIYTCNGTGDQWTLPYTVPSTTGAITSQLAASMCADDYHSGTANGTTIDLYACNGGSAQDWTIEPNGTLQVLGGCMATAADGTTDGTAVQLYACSGDPNQQWIARPDGSLQNRRSGTCLDDPAASLASGTPLTISTCNQSTEQSWTLPTPADSLVLTLTYRWPPVGSGGTEPQQVVAQVTLTCDPTGGTHPDAQNACDDLTAADGDISSIPAVPCTPPDIDDPSTATATGTWDGVPDNYSGGFLNPFCINDDTGGNVFSFVQF